MKKSFKDLIYPSFGNIIDPSFDNIEGDDPCSHSDTGTCPFAYKNDQNVVHCKLMMTWHPITDTEQMKKCIMGKYNYTRDYLAERNRLRKKFPNMEEDTLSF